MRLQCAERSLSIAAATVALVVISAATAIARDTIPLLPGSDPSHPVRPVIDPLHPTVYTFPAPVSGLWYDPPHADGFQYALEGGATFTSVKAPPASFNFGNLDVFVPGPGIVGTALPGVEFNLVPFNTHVFSLLGIDPPVDVADPTAFPTFLDWTGTATKLTMTALLVRTPVPEPGTLAFLVLGAGVTVGSRRFRKRA
jgi:hypothetical protein